MTKTKTDGSPPGENGRARARFKNVTDAWRVFEAVPVPLLILLPDSFFPIAAASDAYLQRAKVSRADVVSKPISAVYPYSVIASGSRESEELHAKLSALVHFNGLTSESSQRIEVPAFDGEAPCVWQTSQKPVLTDDGRLMCILHSLENVTGVPQIEGVGSNGGCERTLRIITDSLPQALWTAWPDGYTDYYNARFSEFMGSPPESAMDGLWVNYIHPDDAEGAKRAWRHSVSTGTPHESTFRVRDKAGAYRWVLSRAMPVRNGDRIVKWVGTNTDIDEKVLAEIELRNSNRRKDEFLAMLAHELRNPLVPINSGAEVLARIGSEDVRIAQVGDMIRRQVAHVSSLIDDLLEASRVNQNRISLEVRTVDMKRVLREAVEQVGPVLDAHHHHLHIALPNEPICVRGDHNRLVQVFTNLLENAGKYTSDGGKISLAATPSNDEVVVTVKDNGAGMTPDLLRRAFEIFEQGARSSARTEGGLGLGLSLVKGLVERQHGTVTANSAGPDQGSEFIVRLPRIEATTIDDVSTTPVPEPAHDLHRHRILLVEDNVDVAESVGMVLEMLGHDVVVEHDSSRAIERAKHASFDRCILDIGLPDMDGYQLSRALRNLPGTQDAVLIAHTGYGQQDDKNLSAQAGFDHHLVKPAAIPDIERVLANKR